MAETVTTAACEMLPMREDGIARLVPLGEMFTIVISAPSLTEVLNVGVRPMETVLVFVKLTGTMRPLPVMVMVCEIPAEDVPSNCTWLVPLPRGIPPITVPGNIDIFPAILNVSGLERASNGIITSLKFKSKTIECSILCCYQCGVSTVAGGRIVFHR